MTESDDYQAEVRQLRNELATLRATGSHLHEIKPRRMTMSEIVESLLEQAKARSGAEHSNVELTRNSKGDTQIKVAVRTGESDEITTVEQAAGKARDVYELLRTFYPMPGAGE